MTIYLKQSTASQEVPLGYFVDSTNGDTEETGLTIANTDIKVWKTGATTLASKNSGGATHISNGVYYAVLDATDTDTLGPLVLFCHVSGALAVRLECCVLAANVYDSLIGASDKLQVHADEITAGLITAAAIATGAIDADAIAADAVTEIQSGLATSAALTTVEGKIDTIDTNVDSILADTGTDGVQVVGMKAAALADFFDTNSGTTYASAVSGSVVKEIADNAGGSALTEAGIADAVWDEVLHTAHEVADSASVLLQASGAAADPWSTALPGAYGAGTAGKIVGDNLNAPVSTVDTVVDAIKAKTDSLTFTVANQIDSNVIDWKGAAAPAMTGDAYARLGAPAGASVSADIADLHTDVADIHTDVGTATTAIGDVHATDLPAVKAVLDNIHDTDLPDLHTDVADIHTDVATAITAIGDVHATDLPAVKSVLDNIHDTDLPAVKTDTAAILADTGTDGVTISAAGADAVLDEVVEGTLTMRQILILAKSVLAGKSSGGGTSTLNFRDHADTKNRVQATVDSNGNRTAVTLDVA